MSAAITSAIEALANRVTALVALDPDIRELTPLVSAMADLIRANTPRALFCLNFTQDTEEGKTQFAFPALQGIPQLLVSGGVIIPRHEWVWSPEDKILTLVIEPDPDNVLELYYLSV